MFVGKAAFLGYLYEPRHIQVKDPWQHATKSPSVRLLWIPYQGNQRPWNQILLSSTRFRFRELIFLQKEHLKLKSFWCLTKGF